MMSFILQTEIHKEWTVATYYRIEKYVQKRYENIHIWVTRLYGIHLM